MPDDKNLNTVQQYVGDMVALESHIEEAIDGQLKEVKDHPQAAAAVQRFHTMVKSHRDSLKSHLESIGGSESHPIKSAVAAVVGMAAGVIDNLRTEGISKSLRDDYTAFNLAAIGYAMLHTTAHLLGQQSTADIAERHLRDYTKAVQEINQLIADVVAWELRKDGHAVNDETVRHATDTLNSAWRDTSPSTGATTRRAA